jgi:hypothetical protein
VVECLSSKCKALSSKPVLTKISKEIFRKLCHHKVLDNHNIYSIANVYLIPATYYFLVVKKFFHSQGFLRIIFPLISATFFWL